MSIPSYPVQLSLEGAWVLVTGGGAIAARKVEELLEAGAKVRVVTVEVGEALLPLVERLHAIDFRPAEARDVLGKALVIAATDDRRANRRIAEAARARGILVVAVDDPEVSSFYSPAVVRRGPLCLAIGTNGAAPLLSAQLRRLFEAAIPEGLSSVADLLAEARGRGLRGLHLRSRLLQALGDGLLGRLVDRGEMEEAGRRLEALVQRAEERFDPGTVAIVGAGPGARAHLTLRALDRLHRADVVVHDALVEPEILAEVWPGTRRVQVGGRVGESAVDPAAVRALLVSEARRGLRVVRLHAGDSGVFGRSAEELDLLAAARVPVEIVPGVSSVLAAPAAAGFPLTARGEATSFRVTTAHTREGYVTALETPPERETLVILMGLFRAREILAGLIRAGRDPATPAAAIDSAGRADERIVRGTLADLADRIEAAALKGPATLVVGAVAGRGAAALRAPQEDAA